MDSPPPPGFAAAPNGHDTRGHHEGTDTGATEV